MMDDGRGYDGKRIGPRSRAVLEVICGRPANRLRSAKCASMAGSVVRLVSDESDYATGASLAVEGGLRL
jgi:hypothetical protein